jgi:hypothetical protein
MEDTDKKEYVRAVLGDRPFTKTYTVFNDLAITFHTLALKESVLLQKYEKIFEEDSYELSLCRMYMHLESPEEELSKTLRLTDTSQGKDAVIALSWTLSKERYNMYLHVYNQFIDLLNELREHTLDKDFWMGAGEA